MTKTLYIPFDPNNIPLNIDKLLSKYPTSDVAYSPNLEKYLNILNPLGIEMTPSPKIPVLYVNYDNILNKIKVGDMSQLSHTAGLGLLDIYTMYTSYDDIASNDKYWDNGVPIDKQIERWKAGEEWERRNIDGNKYWVIYACKLDILHPSTISKSKPDTYTITDITTTIGESNSTPTTNQQTTTNNNNYNNNNNNNNNEQLLQQPQHNSSTLLLIGAVFIAIVLILKK